MHVTIPTKDNIGKFYDIRPRYDTKGFIAFSRTPGCPIIYHAFTMSGLLGYIRSTASVRAIRRQVLAAIDPSLNALYETAIGDAE